MEKLNEFKKLFEASEVSVAISNEEEFNTVVELLIILGFKSFRDDQYSEMWDIIMKGKGRNSTFCLHYKEASSNIINYQDFLNIVKEDTDLFKKYINFTENKKIFTKNFVEIFEKLDVEKLSTGNKDIDAFYENIVINDCINILKNKQKEKEESFI